MEQWQETVQVRLARMEERQLHMQELLLRMHQYAQNTQGLPAQVQQQGEALDKLRQQFQHAKGMAVVLSATVALLASWLPDFLFKK